MDLTPEQIRKNKVFWLPEQDYKKAVGQLSGAILGALGRYFDTDCHYGMNIYVVPAHNDVLAL